MKKIFYLNIVFILLFSYAAVYSQQPAKGLYEQGLEAFKSKNYGSAELIFRKVIDNDDQYKDSAWYYMAISIFYQKKYKSAVFELNRFLLICSSAELCNKSRFWIAECYYYQNDYNTAVEEYKRFISSNKTLYPEFTKEAYMKIGKCYFIQNRNAEAINEWNSALKYTKIKTEIEELYLQIAGAYYSDKNYQTAIQTLDRSINSRDILIRSNSLLLQGKIYYEQNNYNSALNAFNRITKDPLNEESYIAAFYYKALCFEALKDTNNAVVNYDNFIKSSTGGNNYYEARYRKALLIRETDKDEALNEMKKIYEETNNTELKQKVIIDLALFEYENGNKQNAINYLEKISIQLNDSNKETYIKLGEVYMMIKEFSPAEKIFTDILEKHRFDKDADRYQFLLALVFLNKGDYARAAQNFEKIKQLNPFSIYINEAVFFTASAEIENKNYSKAAALLIQYLSIRNIENRMDAIKLQHLAYIKLDDKPKADAALSLLIKSYIRNNDLSENIYNHIMFLRKRKASSLYYENLLLSTYPRSSYTAYIYKDRAETAFSSGNYRTAEQHYTSYLNITGNNSDPEAFVKKAEAIYAQKNYEKAIYYLQNEKLTVYNADAFYSILRILAKSFYHIDDFDKSYEYYLQIRDQNLSEEDNFFLLDIYIRKKLLTKALELLPLLEKNREYYPESLYLIGMYHKSYNEYEDAFKYFDLIQDKYPQSIYTDMAVYESAEIDYQSSNFDEASAKIEQIKNSRIKTKGEILLSLIYLKTDRLKEASVLADRNINSFIKFPECEILLKALVEYSYSKKNSAMLLRYSSFLVKNFPDNSAFTDYYKAKYYYDVKNFQKSYTFYLKLSNSDNQYRNESFYFLGQISIYTFHKNQQAIEMYKKVTAESNELYMKSRINLAMLYYESGKNEESMSILNQLRALDKSIKYQKQAENLYEQYAFDVQN
ncbi:MAG: tetratricopeptide repeat protein [Spirochaetes bacterium]|nr:tetratricopeptide repeat protein [Spirochaetota bacterium]